MEKGNEIYILPNDSKEAPVNAYVAIAKWFASKTCVLLFEMKCHNKNRTEQGNERVWAAI